MEDKNAYLTQVIGEKDSNNGLCNSQVSNYGTELTSRKTETRNGKRYLLKEDDDYVLLQQPKKQKLSTAFVNSSKDTEEEMNKLKHCDPVLQLNLPSSTNSTAFPDITLNSSSSLSVLETLLYPLSSTTFLTTCFRKKAVHINSNDSQRVSKLNSKYMFDLDAKQIFEGTSSDSVFLWIPNKSQNEEIKIESDTANQKAYKISPPPLQSIELQDPEMAYLLHKSSNYASYCRAPPELEQPLVYNMLKDTGIGCGQYENLNDESSFTSPISTMSLGRGEVETFIGTKNHITDWHIDFQENFTIQLSGCKKWFLKQGSLKHPLRGVTPHYENTKDVIENQLKATKLSNPNFVYGKQDISNNAFGDEAEITMNAGDVLYFPAGMWHKVETLEYGVSINISLMGSNYASIVCAAMEHVLLKKEEWRETICNKNTNLGLDNPYQNCDNVIKKLDSLLNELPDIIRKFHKDGGAQCILPPVLRRAPNYSLVNDDEDQEEEDYCDGDSVKTQSEEKDSTITSGDSEEEEEEEEEKNGNSVNEKTEEFDNDNGNSDDGILENGDAIDIKSFQSPENHDRPTLHHIIKRNPLATMMKMADITSFGLKRNISSKYDDENYFILNVCYAGNEQHESSVRTIFFDDTGFLSRICDIEKRGIAENNEAAFQNALTNLSRLDALFYYGYLNWVQWQ